MTTIITRLYPDLATARAVAADLKARDHDPATIDIITRDGEGSLEARLKAARVLAAQASAYAPHLANGAALVVVRAPFNPIGTALHAMRVVNRTPSVDVGLADQDVYLRDEAEVVRTGKVLPGTVFFMSNPHRSMSHGHILGSNPILPPRTRKSAIAGGAYMSTKFWPGRLVSPQKERSSAIRGGFLFSSLIGMPTVIREWSPRELVPTTI